MMSIKVMLDKEAYMPEKAHKEDAGFDLRTPRGAEIWPGQGAVFDTGVHILIPEGFTGEIVSRSGMNINHSIVCPQGTVDAGYTGSIKVKLYNLGEEIYEVKPGDKIAQLIIVPIAETELRQVESLEDTERGDNGFGSSGR